MLQRSARTAWRTPQTLLKPCNCKAWRVHPAGLAASLGWRLQWRKRRGGRSMLTAHAEASIVAQAAEEAVALHPIVIELRVAVGSRNQCTSE